MRDQNKICKFINCSTTRIPQFVGCQTICGLRDAGTQKSTNLIQLAPQPAILHFVGCGVREDTNQTKIIGSSQPTFRTLRDAELIE